MKTGGKFLKILIFALAVCAALTINAAAADTFKSGTYGKNIEWTLDVEGVLTISGTGEMPGYDWWRIPWYPYGEYVKSVVVESGVTSICADAFLSNSNTHNCYDNLSSVTILGDLKTIGNGAFYGCTNLSDIILPASVTSIDSSAFSGCTSLTSINIPSGIVSIGDYTFSGCTGLTSITIPSSVTSIGESAFFGCAGLTNIVIPDGVVTIGEYAFSNCGELTSVSIPNSVTSIGDNAFAECTIEHLDINMTCVPDCFKQYKDYRDLKSSLKTVKFGNQVETLTDNVFSDCTGLTSVSLPDSITTIGSGAFSNCSNLTDVVMSDGVTCINDNTFSYCTSLRSITIPDSVTSIGEYAFRSCSSLTDIELPNDLSTLGACAFYDCSALVNVNIPEGIRTINDSTFAYCDSLTSITIPEGVTSIDNRAFGGCDNLKKVTIPNSVTSIDEWAFSSPIETLEINMTCIPSCFRRRATLKTVILGNKVETISNNAFTNCSSLTSVRLPNGIKSISNGAFSWCNSLPNIVIPDSITSINDYAFYNCSSLTSINLPDGLTSIGKFAFSGCNSLTGVNLPSSLTSIGEYAFENCRDLTSANLPYGLTSVGKYTFYNCRSLTSISLPDSLTSIGEYAFDGCDNLTGINLPNSLTSIGEYAFRDCDSLTNVVIPEGITAINNYTFSFGWKSKLENVVIPDSVISIGDYAFNWARCKIFTISSNTTDISEKAFDDYANSIIFKGTKEEYEQVKDLLPSTNNVSFYENDSSRFIYNDNGSYFAIASEGVGYVQDDTTSSITIGGREYAYSRQSDIVSLPGMFSRQYVLYSLDSADEVCSVEGLGECSGTVTQTEGRRICVGERWFTISSPCDVTAASLTGQYVTVYYGYGDKAYRVAVQTFVVGTLTAIDLPTSTAFIDGTGYPVVTERDESALNRALLELLEQADCVFMLEDGKVAGGRTLRSYLQPTLKLTTQGAPDVVNGQVVNARCTGKLELTNDVTADCPPAVRETLEQRTDLSMLNISAFVIETKDKQEDRCQFDPTAARYTDAGSRVVYIRYDEGNALYLGQTCYVAFALDINDNWKAQASPDGILTLVGTVSHDGVKASDTAGIRLSNTDERERQRAQEEAARREREALAEEMKKSERSDAKKAGNALNDFLKHGLAVSWELAADLGLKVSDVEELAKDAMARAVLFSTPVDEAEERMYRALNEAGEILKKEIPDTECKKIVTKLCKRYEPALKMDSDSTTLHYIVNTKKEYGEQRVAVTISVSKFSLEGTDFCMTGQMNYEVLGPAGKNKRIVPTPYRKGLLASINGADVKSFANAAWSMAESELKQAYTKVFGSDFNAAMTDIFGQVPIQILKQAFGKDPADLVWMCATHPTTKLKIQCPVNVFVYDADDTLCGSIEDNEVTLASDDFSLWVEGDTKHIDGLPEGYRVQYVATANGTMDVDITEYTADDTPLRSVQFQNVVLLGAVRYQQSVPDSALGEADGYAISSGSAVYKKIADETLLLTLKGLPDVSAVSLTGEQAEGGYNVTLRLKNEGGAAQTVRVLLAGYDENDRFVASSSDELELAAGADVTRTCLLKTGGTLKSVKAFLIGETNAPLAASAQWLCA